MTSGVAVAWVFWETKKYFLVNCTSIVRIGTVSLGPDVSASE